MRNLTGDASIGGIMKRFLGLTLVGVLLLSGVASAKSAGIWYEVLYSKEKNYNWMKGFGVGAQNKLTGDVNGDGKDDAVIYLNYGTLHHRGAFHVALSDGTKFGTQTEWLDRNATDPSGAKTFLGDANGDGKDDAIIYYDSKNGGIGVWEVGLSTGTSFSTPTEWRRGHGLANSYHVADVNGDGKDEPVIFIDVGGAQGNWHVSTSNGSSFGTPSHWNCCIGHTSTRQFLKDVTGDGKADAIAYFGNNGPDWHVASSTGTVFNNATVWKQSYYPGTIWQDVADVSGDGKGDAIVYWGTIDSGFGGENAAMFKAESSGSGFGAGAQLSAGHGNYIAHNKVGQAHNLLFGDVDGDGDKESIAYHEVYTNNAGAGIWKVLFKEYGFPDYQNYWEALTIEHVPTGGLYDSGDTTKIEEHLDQIDDADIDFILIDLTNGVRSHTWIHNRAKAVCNQLAVHNANGGSLKFAIASGKVQYSNNVADVEVEAQQVLDDFVNDPTCGPHYYQTNSKPLLEVHFNSYSQKQSWLSASHSASNSFEVKYGLGQIPVAQGTPPSSSGSSCGGFPSGPTPPWSDLHNYIGWSTPYGTWSTGPWAVVMPGTNNKHGNVAKRNGTGYQFYEDCAWDRVQANKANIDTVLINSYNEYAEETAVAPTDTTQFTSQPVLSEPWNSSSMYWNMTVNEVYDFKH